jgi:alpha-tubulin suppressor-like RCC1 family protein
MRATLAIRRNGTAWGWGCNACGNLGDNTTVNKSSPVSVVGGFTDWCQISASGFFGNNTRLAVAVRQNGTAWAWGYNSAGQLGDNTTSTRSSPVSVVGGFTNWCQVAAGVNFALGVRTNGTLWAWGNNGTGQLGTNNTTQSSSPVSVIGGFTDWCQVTGSFSQFGTGLAVRTNGTLWAWGYNGQGQLGDNTTANKSSPVSVIGGFTDWCQVTVGNKFSVAVRQNGTAWAWGYNRNGELGSGQAGYFGGSCSTISPVQVVGGFTDWCQVSGGVEFANAVRQNGTAWAWGRGQNNQLGTGNTSARSSPVSIAGGFTDWTQTSAGRYNSAGLRSSDPYIIN